MNIFSLFYKQSEKNKKSAKKASVYFKHLSFARHQMKNNQLVEACQNFQKLVDGYPEEKPGFIGLANTAQKMNNWPEALKYWEIINTRFPKTEVASRKYCHALLKADTIDNAEKAYEEHLSLWPEDHHAWNALFNIADKRRDNSLLLKRIREKLHHIPNDPVATLYKSLAQARNVGEVNKLEIAVKKILSSHENIPVSQSFLSMLFRAIQRYITGQKKRLFLQQLTEIVRKYKDSLAKNNADIMLAKIYYALDDMEQFMRITQMLSKTSKHKEINELGKIAANYNSPGFPDFLAPKVFGIGLSKTATSSLNLALNILNIHSIHWHNPYTQDLISDKDYLLFEGFTDIGVSSRFEWLNHTFPNAKFIYTNRQMEPWIQSMTKHYKWLFNVDTPSELRNPVISKRFDYQAGWIEAGLYSKFDTWENVYTNYDNRVRAFFKDAPKDKFLELRICEGEGWQELCQFLGKDIPELPFPRDNITYY